MPVPTTADEFLCLVQKSGVVDKQRLGACVARACGALPSEPGLVADLLVRDGLLTPFQAEQVLRGRIGFLERSPKERSPVERVPACGRVSRSRPKLSLSPAASGGQSPPTGTMPGS